MPRKLHETDDEDTYDDYEDEYFDVDNFVENIFDDLDHEDLDNY